jgi:hypothetical protein
VTKPGHARHGHAPAVFHRANCLLRSTRACAIITVRVIQQCLARMPGNAAVTPVERYVCYPNNAGAKYWN